MHEKLFFLYFCTRCITFKFLSGYILLMNFLRDASYDTANHFDDSVYWNLEKGETLEGSKILEELSSVSSI